MQIAGQRNGASPRMSDSTATLNMHASAPIPRMQPQHFALAAQLLRVGLIGTLNQQAQTANDLNGLLHLQHLKVLILLLIGPRFCESLLLCKLEQQTSTFDEVLCTLHAPVRQRRIACRHCSPAALLHSARRSFAQCWPTATKLCNTPASASGNVCPPVAAARLSQHSRLPCRTAAAATATYDVWCCGRCAGGS